MNLDSKIKEAFMRHETDVRPRPGAWTDVERSIGRSHKRRAVAAGVGAALAIAGAVLIVPRIGGEPSPSSVASPGEGRPQLIAKIDAPVYRMYAGGDAIWGLSSPAQTGRVRDTLLRIDPRAQKVAARIPLGENANGIAADNDSVWVTHNDECYGADVCLRYETAPIPRNSVARFDAKTGRLVATIDVYHPQDVESAFDAVWVTSAGEPGTNVGTRLVRIDPATNRVTASILLGTTENYAKLDYGDRYLWVANPLENGDTQLVRVDPRTHETEGMATLYGGGTASVAVGNGSVWVTETTRDASKIAVVRIDPGTGQLVGRIELPEDGPVNLQALAVGQGFVWAATTNGTLWKIDASTNKTIGDPVEIGRERLPAPDVVTGFASVWVAGNPQADGKIWRFQP